MEKIEVQKDFNEDLYDHLDIGRRRGKKDEWEGDDDMVVI
jgi:hypothetical protein